MKCYPVTNGNKQIKICPHNKKGRCILLKKKCDNKQSLMMAFIHGVKHGREDAEKELKAKQELDRLLRRIKARDEERGLSNSLLLEE
jgi:hypothetical protein